MEPIWAAVVAGIAVVFLAADFWWDKRKTERKEKAHGIAQIHPDGTLTMPYIPHEPTNANAWDRNIGQPLAFGQEPQAYYRVHNDLYILPLRSYEWETLRYALNTMPPKTMYTGDRNTIIRRMENVDK